MNDRADGSRTVDRTRLCELAGLPRGRHIRWTKAGILREKALYRELDVIKAAAYDELQTHLKPKLAQAAWGQVSGEVDHPGQRLDVVVCVATRTARVVRTAEELDVALPRNEPSVVVNLHPRLLLARQRLAAYRASMNSPAPTAPQDAVHRDSRSRGDSERSAP